MNGKLIIKYKGRYGNHLFMYIIARLYADKYKLLLINNINSSYFKISKNNLIKENNKNNKNNLIKENNKLKTYEITDKDYNLETNSLPFYGPGIYIFNGFFQNENFFYINKERILNIINFKINPKKTCVLHLRLDDYLHKDRSWIINHNYYIDCIKKYCSKYDKIYIICDKLRHNWEKKYMKKLIIKICILKKKPIYKIKSLNNDIQSIIDAECIITSNSTFCFWASFFSKAEKIISFPYMGLGIYKNKTIKKWKNYPIIFKYNKDNKFIFNNDFSKNIINYFENI